MATIRDVAKEAGVSVSTVSIVLNGQCEERHISAATKEKVLRAAAAVRYQPNLSARKLRQVAQQEYTVGVYWASDTRVHVLTRVLRGLQRAIPFADNRIKVVICPFTVGKLREDQSLHSTTAYNAVIIGTINQTDLEDLELDPPPIPVVLFNRMSDRFSGVGTDNRATGALAAKQFISRDVKDIGMVCNEVLFLAMEQRSESFRIACAEAGVPIPENRIVSCEDSIAGGAAAAEMLLNKGRLPRAIFCADDQVALGVSSILQRRGVRIPEDVRLLAIGMGSSDLCSYSVPSISVVELPIEKMAEGALSLVWELLTGEVKEHTFHSYPVSLHLRESCN